MDGTLPRFWIPMRSSINRSESECPSMSFSPPESNESSQDAEQLSRLVTELRYRNDDLQRRNDDLLAVVNRLNDSIGWRMLQRVRRIVSALLPAGTRRRRWSGLASDPAKSLVAFNLGGKCGGQAGGEPWGKLPR